MKLTHFVNDEKIEEYNKINNQNKENNKNYQFYLDNIRNNIYITDRLIFERENDEYIVHIEIGENNICNIVLKEKNISLDIKVIHASYEEKDNAIEYEYILETDNNKHKVILEIEE